MASSVGSSVRTTRYSRSRIETASVWSGALTTTRGRESAGMDASPFRSVGRPLLAGGEDPARRVARERRTVERSAHGHPTPALGAGHGAQLAGGGEADLGLPPQPTGRRAARLR